MLIRYSKTSDKEEIKELLLSCFNTSSNEQAVNENYNKKCEYCSMYILEDIENKFIVCEEDSRIVGLTWVSYDTIYNGLEIGLSCVAQDYRNRGYMTKLIDRALKIENKECSDIYCATDSETLGNILRKYNFKEIDAAKADCLNIDRLIMYKNQWCLMNCAYMKKNNKESIKRHKIYVRKIEDSNIGVK